MNVIHSRTTLVGPTAKLTMV